MNRWWWQAIVGIALLVFVILTGWFTFLLAFAVLLGVPLW